MQNMIQISDNNATKVFTDLYGFNALNFFAGSFGLSNTVLNHHIGCFNTTNHNWFSPRDAVSIYEGLANETFFDRVWTDTQFQIMGYWDITSPGNAFAASYTSHSTNRPGVPLSSDSRCAAVMASGAKSMPVTVAPSRAHESVSIPKWHWR